MVSSILYQNESATTILLDLPQSLENGQNVSTVDSTVESRARILLNPPLERPFASTEPRAVKGKDLSSGIPQPEQRYHQKLQDLIARSLDEIELGRDDQEWCLSRRFRSSPVQENATQFPLSKRTRKSRRNPPVILSTIPNVFPSLSEVVDRLCHNPSGGEVRLIAGPHIFHIPPYSSFCLSHQHKRQDWLADASRSLLPQTFDLVLMDPPWSNRSVKRSASYLPSGTDPFSDALSLMHNRVRPSGYMGVWVTNKAAVRRAVLETCHQYHLRLYEEWVWIKIARDGQPILPLRGLWRRPYEVLLLFHRDHRSRHHIPDMTTPSDVFDWDQAQGRRILAAVPAAHSQKPCLKEAVGQILFASSDFQAAEVFARKVTAGWFSCGNEVLKFNEHGYWTKHSD